NSSSVRARPRGQALRRLRHGTDDALHMLRRDEPRAFELPRRVLLARAPEEILVVEAHQRIVPAAIAGVVVDDAVRRRELIGRMGEATDEHDWLLRRPGEPGEAAREADEELGVTQPAHALGQGPIAGLVLHAVRNMVPDQVVAVHRLLVDADDAIAE